MGTQFVFAGAEVPSHRLLLVRAGVKRLAVNYWRLKKRGLPKTKAYQFTEKVGPDVSIYMTPGDPDLSGDDLDDYAREYLAFIMANSDRLAAVAEVTLPVAARAAHRSALVDAVGEQVAWVAWDPTAGSLDTLAQDFAHVALRGDDIEADTTLHGRLRALQGLHGTRWHALAYARPDDLRALPLDTVSSMAWLAPMLRGETIVWDGTKLVRYPKRMKDQARVRLGPVCERAGLDHALIKADDHNEVARLAIWSYLQLESGLSDHHDRPFTVIEGGDEEGQAQRSDHRAWADDPGDAESGGAAVDHSLPSMHPARNSRQVEIRSAEERATLPVVAFDMKTVIEKDDGGHDVLRDLPVVRSQSESLRQCNTCFVQSNCPAFKPNNSCAFSLPVEVKTKDQLRSLLNAVIEMQGQRVFFARFSEEMNGGYPDPNTSQEVDRLFKLVKIIKELEDNREFIKITAERSSSSGVLSAIFGDRAQTLRELPGGGLGEGATNTILRDGP